MTKYPIGIQNFAKLRQNGFLYVDKTEYIHRLVDGGTYFFLSRPRRFGKSLLMSTIEAYFQGRRELFEGLAITGYDHEWVQYPVFHLQLNKPVITKLTDIEDKLYSFIREQEAIYGTDETSANIPLRFGALIKKAHQATGRKVVILIDEYDKPLLDTVDKPELQAEVRSLLKGLYSNLKDMDAHIEFAMLTGVTKFGKLSIFSDLNNLKDISLDARYSCICGITRDELNEYFGSGIAQLAQTQNVSTDEACELLQKNYDGYHFAPGAPDIYNPFSLINCLDEGRFGNYWFETGTPTFLVKMIKDEQLKLKDLSEYQTNINSLGSISFSLGNLVPVLYQSGYLTIKGTSKRFPNNVILGYPNWEVENGFLCELMAMYTPVAKSDTEFAVTQFVDDVENARTDSFMTRLQGLFSGYQYDQIELGNLELHYRNVIYLVMRLMGYYTHAEMQTANGRIDLLVKTSDYIYLFEFKLDGTAKEALDQINERLYLLPFNADGRKVFKIGANFSSRLRSIENWMVQTAYKPV